MMPASMHNPAIAVVVLVALTLVAPAAAQGTAGSARGQVLDATGGEVRDAAVVLVIADAYALLAGFVWHRVALLPFPASGRVAG